MLKENEHVFQDDPKWHEIAKQVASKTFELTQFIVRILGVTKIDTSLPGTAVFHTSCHMTRLLGVKEGPKLLLNGVDNLTIRPLTGQSQCCGFGGTFSVKMGDISAEMVKEKVEHIKQTSPGYLIGADCGCLMNIGGRISRE